MTKEYFTRKEALESIKEVLSDGFDEKYRELFDTVFNSNYYIMYTCEAERALFQYGVFKAIGQVQKYEMNNWDKIDTDFSKPTNVVNRLWYVIGDSVINDIDLINDLRNEQATEENNKKIIAEIDGMIKEL